MGSGGQQKIGFLQRGHSVNHEHGGLNAGLLLYLNWSRPDKKHSAQAGLQNASPLGQTRSMPDRSVSSTRLKVGYRDGGISTVQPCTDGPIVGCHTFTICNKMVVHIDQSQPCRKAFIGCLRTNLRVDGHQSTT